MRPPQWAVVAPIEVEELTKTIKDMPPESATGPDNISVHLIKAMPRLLLTALLNLWLLVGKIPAPLKHARTVLVPKVPGAAQPQQHRPITIAPAVVRCYTKLMAKRAASLCSLHPAQRAFIEADGTAENIILLATMMRDAQQKLQPMANGRRLVGHGQGIRQCLPPLHQASSEKSGATTACCESGRRPIPRCHH